MSGYLDHLKKHYRPETAAINWEGDPNTSMQHINLLLKNHKKFLDKIK